MFQNLAQVESIPHWNLETITLFWEQKSLDILVLQVVEHGKLLPTFTAIFFLKKEYRFNLYNFSDILKETKKIIPVIFLVIYFSILILVQIKMDWFLDNKFSLRFLYL